MLVLGATGDTGQQVVSQALQQGHDVTVLVRAPERLPIAHDRVRVLTGSVTDNSQALGAAVREQEVVISALGVGKSVRSHGLMTQSAPRIVRAMEEQGVRRLIWTSAFGVGETYRDVPWIPRIFIRLLLQDIYRDKAAGEPSIRASALDWTIVYPSGLVNGAPTGRYRVGERLPLRGFPRITRADVAAFLLTQIDDRRYIKKGVLISS